MRQEWLSDLELPEERRGGLEFLEERQSGLESPEERQSGLESPEERCRWQERTTDEGGSAERSWRRHGHTSWRKSQAADKADWCKISHKHAHNAYAYICCRQFKKSVILQNA